METSYAGYTAAQCFSLPSAEEQVACSASNLNIYDPPR